MKKMLKKPTKDITLVSVNAYNGEGCITGSTNKCSATGGSCTSVNIGGGGGILESIIGLFKK